MELSTAAVRTAAEVLDRAIAGEREAVAGVLRAVVRGDIVPAGAHDVAWWLAGTTVGRGLARGPWRLDFPTVDEAPYETRWVARFLSAYVNEDLPTARALVTAARADGQLAGCLQTLVSSAVATLRRRWGVAEPPDQPTAPC